MGNPSPLFDALMGQLTFEWSDRDEIVEFLTRRVPPGKALRAYDTALESRIRTGRGHNRAESETVRLKSGSRMIANKTVSSAIATGKVERSEVNGKKVLRKARKQVFTSDERAIVADTIDAVLRGTDRHYSIPIEVLLLPAQVRKDLVERITSALVDAHD